MTQHSAFRNILYIGNFFKKTFGLLSLIIASPTFAQFSPKDLSDMQVVTGPVVGVQEGSNSATNATGMPPKNESLDLNSAAGICNAAQQAKQSYTPFIFPRTDLTTLRASARNLPSDAKDQFETVAEYDARQVARRVAWAQKYHFLVLPTSVNLGGDVYNAETQTYIIEPGARVTVKPSGWDDRYGLESGFVAIDVGKVGKIEVQMDPQSARQFFAQSGDHEVVYIVQPQAPYFQETSRYPLRYHLLTSTFCSFVRRKADQKVLYFVGQ